LGAGAESAGVITLGEILIDLIIGLLIAQTIFTVWDNLR
jgi:hypothetical protein